MEQKPEETVLEEAGKEDPGTGLNEVQQLIILAASQIEDRLLSRLNAAIEGINSKIDTSAAQAIEITANAKTAMETLPAVIQEHVEGQLRANLTGIIEEVGNKFEEKIKTYTGGNGAGGMDFLDKAMAHSDKIIGIVNAFRSPTTEQAMMGQMGMIFRWHTLLSKLEKGGGNPEDVTQAIANTFTQSEE